MATCTGQLLDHFSWATIKENCWEQAQRGTIRLQEWEKLFYHALRVEKCRILNITKIMANYWRWFPQLGDVQVEHFSLPLAATLWKSKLAIENPPSKNKDHCGFFRRCCVWKWDMPPKTRHSNGENMRTQWDNAYLNSHFLADFHGFPIAAIAIFDS